MTRLSQVRALTEQQVRCNVLRPSIPLYCLDADLPAGDALAELRDLSFDSAPVLPKTTLRYTTVDALAEAPSDARVSDHALPLSAADVLSVDAPLTDAIALLRDRPFFFLQERRQVVAVVTRADLDHPAISAYVFRTLMAVESGLDALIPSYAPEELWWGKILKDDQKKIEEIYQSRKQFNAETTRFQAMMLRHRLKVLRKVPELRQDVIDADLEPLFERRGEDDTTQPIHQLRNTLAHGGSLLHAFPDPDDALDILRRVERLAERIWILVGGRAQLWRVYGRTLLQLDDPSPMTLNGPDAVPADAVPWPVFGLSASNPYDQQLTDNRNAQRTARLASLITRKAEQTWEGWGAAADGSYRERTVFAAGLEQSDALELGQYFGQRAIFRVDAHKVTALSCPDGEVLGTWERCWSAPDGPATDT